MQLIMLRAYVHAIMLRAYVHATLLALKCPRES